jgi:hypothetical protein
MKTHYSITYQPGGVGDEHQIGNAILNLQSCINLAKSHSCKAGHDFKHISHWYHVTEWNEDEEIINQMNLEDSLYEKAETN